LDIRYIITLAWFLLLIVSIIHLQVLYNQIAKLKPEILILDESKYEVIKQAMKFNNEFVLSVSDMNITVPKGFIGWFNNLHRHSFKLVKQLTRKFTGQKTVGCFTPFTILANNFLPLNVATWTPLCQAIVSLTTRRSDSSSTFGVY